MIEHIAIFKNDVVEIVYWEDVYDTMLNEKVVKQKNTAYTSVFIYKIIKGD